MTGPGSTDAGAIDAIGQGVARFAYRDQGRWDELLSLFHPAATIAVTWYDGPIEGFVEQSRAMSARGGALTKHFIGASRIEARGDRALADTDVVIMARARIAGREADVTAWARFFDRFEHRTGTGWRIAARTAVYEKDRLDPVAPSWSFGLVYRLGRFERYPAAYRHLAAGLTRGGQTLAKTIITAGTPEERALIDAGRRWLAAEPAP